MSNPNNRFALIVAYYLARFNREGLEKLGFKSFRDVFRATAASLDVKENYVKLRRDEFDFIFDWRRGFQRPMHKQITRVVEVFQDLEEEELRVITENILYNKVYLLTEEADEISDAIKLSSERGKKKKRASTFILRGPTGKIAEAFFQTHFNQTFEPVEGNLIDTREWGCGYDFKIESGKRETFVEVKGLSEISGGILFTDKEWKTAKEKTDSYYLAIVRNVTKEPEIQFIQNPAGIFQPDKNIYTSIQVQWSVSDKVLKNVSI